MPDNREPSNSREAAPNFPWTTDFAASERSESVSNPVPNQIVDNDRPSFDGYDVAGSPTGDAERARVQALSNEQTRQANAVRGRQGRADRRL